MEKKCKKNAKKMQKNCKRMQKKCKKKLQKIANKKIAHISMYVLLIIHLVPTSM